MNIKVHKSKVLMLEPKGVKEKKNKMNRFSLNNKILGFLVSTISGHNQLPHRANESSKFIVCLAEEELKQCL